MGVPDLLAVGVPDLLWCFMRAVGVPDLLWVSLIYLLIYLCGEAAEAGAGARGGVNADSSAAVRWPDGEPLSSAVHPQHQGVHRLRAESGRPRRLAPQEGCARVHRAAARGRDGRARRHPGLAQLLAQGYEAAGRDDPLNGKAPGAPPKLNAEQRRGRQRCHSSPSPDPCCEDGGPSIPPGSTEQTDFTCHRCLSRMPQRLCALGPPALFHAAAGVPNS